MPAKKKVAKATSEEDERIDDTPETPESDERITPPDDEQAPAPEEPKGDYLRQYQYKKQTVPGSPQSDPALGSKAETMKKFLLLQPTVRIFIPRRQGEAKDVKLSVTLNGYRLDLPKQIYLVLPIEVAKIVMDSLDQTEAAIMRGQITGDSDKEKALG